MNAHPLQAAEIPPDGPFLIFFAGKLRFNPLIFEVGFISQRPVKACYQRFPHLHNPPDGIGRDRVLRMDHIILLQAENCGPPLKDVTAKLKAENPMLQVQMGKPADIELRQQRVV
ncbi:hypothetical protein D3C74_361200 [compost metagenome]